MTSTLNQKETLLKHIDSKHQVKRTEQALSSGKKCETIYITYCVSVLLHINKAQKWKIENKKWSITVV